MCEGEPLSETERTLARLLNPDQVRTEGLEEDYRIPAGEPGHVRAAQDERERQRQPPVNPYIKHYRQQLGQLALW